MTPAGRPRVAVLDIGSNSTRLFLCAGRDADGPAGERSTVVTGLRRGAAPDGTVARDALARLQHCLEGFAARITAFRPDVVVAAATSAVRDAPNRDAIAAVVRGTVGVDPVVLTGDEEAALAFAGARLAVPPGAGCAVVDVGGGSTEVARGAGDAPDAAVSLQLGAVRCTEEALPGDPPAPADLDALARRVRDAAAPHVAPLAAGEVAVGVAGTVTTIAAVTLGRYDPARVHRLRLTRDGVRDVGARLAALPLAARAAVPGLEPARAPVIVAGCVIVAEVMALLGARELVVSERDILDGVAMLHGA